MNQKNALVPVSGQDHLHELGIVDLDTRVDFTVDPLLHALLNPTTPHVLSDTNDKCTIVVNNVC